MYKILIIITITLTVLIILLMTRANRYITYFILNKIYLHNKKKNKDIPKITITIRNITSIKYLFFILKR